MNAYLLAADVEVVELAEASQGLLQDASVDLVGHILDVAQGVLLLAGTRLGLLVIGASSLPARAIARSSLLGADLSSRGSGSSRSSLRGAGSWGSGLGGNRGSSRSGSSNGGGGSGGGTDLRGNGSPGLGTGGDSGSRLLLDRCLLLRNRGRSRLGGQRLLLGDIRDSGGSGGLLLLGGSAVGLGGLNGDLSLTIDLLLKLLINLVGGSVIGHLSVDSRGGLSNLGSLSNRRGSLDLLNNLIFFLNQVTEDIVQNVVAVGLLGQDEGLDELARRLRLVGDLTDDGDQDVVEGSLGVNVQDANLALLEVKLLDLVVDSLRFDSSQLVLYSYGIIIWRNRTHLGTNGDRNGLSLSTEDQLGTSRVEEMELVRVATHSSIVLLNEEPAHLILGDVALVIGRSGVGRGGGLSRLEVGRSVHSGVGRVERVVVGMLSSVVTVKRSLGHVGHGDRGVFD